jgi:hypothetical protein
VQGLGEWEVSKGCAWQEKSFSVAMGSKVLETCFLCGASCQVTYKHNGDLLCRACFDKLPSRINSGELGKFFTSKDKMWEFTDENTTGRPVEIRSKGQWKRHIKSLGLNDDVKQSRSGSEIRESFTEKSKFQPTGKKEIAKTVHEIMRERRRIRL